MLDQSDVGNVKFNVDTPNVPGSIGGKLFVKDANVESPATYSAANVPGSTGGKPFHVKDVNAESPGNQQGAVGGSNVQINCSNSDQGGLIELEKLLKQKTFTRPEIDHLIALMQARVVDALIRGRRLKVSSNKRLQSDLRVSLSCAFEGHGLRLVCTITELEGLMGLLADTISVVACRNNIISVRKPGGFGMPNLRQNSSHEWLQHLERRS
ncbi:hypothetical protein KIW84_014129 [Lathyrus oleraceus]|uniref:Uncharacterized protein n=1 Tax=Pisum sativum TaxID=3888 RepID=A0A9D5BMH3_PEA|nr:hypothetical protein KIW84_014129 [Pisum sativum]